MIRISQYRDEVLSLDKIKAKYFSSVLGLIISINGVMLTTSWKKDLHGNITDCTKGIDSYSITVVTEALTLTSASVTPKKAKNIKYWKM